MSLLEEMCAARDAGDVRRYQALRNRVVTAHADVAKGIAKHRKGGSLEDRVQDALLGLLEACDTYDPSKGASFATYAAWCLASPAKGQRLVHIPTRALDEARRGVRDVCTSRPASLDAPIGDDGDDLGDLIGDDAEGPEEALLRKEREALAKDLYAHSGLTPRERRVVRARFSDDGAKTVATYQEIGLAMGLTRARVQQILKGALAKMRAGK